MTSKRFQELQVYQLAERLFDEFWQIVNTWEPFVKDTIGKQIVPSVDSIGANIAEDVGRVSYQDNRLVIIAISSLNETQHWLRQAYNRKLLTGQQVDLLKLILE